MLLQSMDEAVEGFRTGRDGAASDALARFTDGLVQLLQQVGDAQVANALLPYLKEALAAQERGDMLRVADMLEYELGPILRRALEPEESAEA